MSLMTKKQAYQNLLNLVSENNQSFRIRISDKKGRCRTYGGKAGHTRPRADFLKEVTQFRNVVNGLGESKQKIDITIPEFPKRPEPVTQPKKIISSKYNKTCKCQIKIYDNPCTYWLGWNNGYFTTKGNLLKQYKKMIDDKFNADELLLSQQEEKRLSEEKRIADELLLLQQQEESYFELDVIEDTKDSMDTIDTVDTIDTKIDSKIPLGIGGLAIAGIIAYLVFKK